MRALSPQPADSTQKYKQMKENGVRPDDPEFLKAHNLLSAVTQQQHFAKQRQLEAQRRQQQQLQQNQANGATSDNTANGVNGKYMSTLE